MTQNTWIWCMWSLFWAIVSSAVIMFSNLMTCASTSKRSQNWLVFIARREMYNIRCRHLYVYRFQLEFLQNPEPINRCNCYASNTWFYVAVAAYLEVRISFTTIEREPYVIRLTRVHDNHSFYVVQCRGERSKWTSFILCV